MEAVAAEESKNLRSLTDGIVLKSCAWADLAPAVLPDPIDTARFLDEADMACDEDMAGFGLLVDLDRSLTV
jgi:hypothetical protein